MNEIFIVIITLHVIGYSEMLDDSQVKIIIGWSMITFICLMLAFNLSPILFDLFNSIKLLSIKFYRKVMRWVIINLLGKMPKKPQTTQELIEFEKIKI